MSDLNKGRTITLKDMVVELGFSEAIAVLTKYKEFELANGVRDMYTMYFHSGYYNRNTIH